MSCNFYKPGYNKTITATAVKLTIHYYKVLILSMHFFFFMPYCHDTRDSFVSIIAKKEHGKMEMA
jgi:hypothetical protein